MSNMTFMSVSSSCFQTGAWSQLCNHDYDHFKLLRLDHLTVNWNRSTLYLCISSFHILTYFTCICQQIDSSSFIVCSLFKRSTSKTRQLIGIIRHCCFSSLSWSYSHLRYRCHKFFLLFFCFTIYGQLYCNVALLTFSSRAQ